jgi:hypothetical protein
MYPAFFGHTWELPEETGLCAVRHTSGLYDLLDELARGHRGLVLDNCASGGRHFDSQFHGPDKEEGIMQGLGGAAVAPRACTLRLKDLDPGQTYTVADWDNSFAPAERSSTDFAEGGIEIRANDGTPRRPASLHPEPPLALIVHLCHANFGLPGVPASSPWRDGGQDVDSLGTIPLRCHP